MSTAPNQSVIEHAALEWFREPGNAVGHGSKKSRTLAALRDTLLPRLLSGELSVAEEEAVT
jgi:hypothetical protein